MKPSIQERMITAMGRFQNEVGMVFEQMPPAIVENLKFQVHPDLWSEAARTRKKFFHSESGKLYGSKFEIQKNPERPTSLVRFGFIVEV